LPPEKTSAAANLTENWEGGAGSLTIRHLARTALAKVIASEECQTILFFRPSAGNGTLEVKKN
jgi:hypothetical protein